MHSPFTLCMNFLHVQMICVTDLYDCVNPLVLKLDIHSLAHHLCKM